MFRRSTALLPMHAAVRRAHWAWRPCHLSSSELHATNVAAPIIQHRRRPPKTSCESLGVAVRSPVLLLVTHAVLSFIEICPCPGCLHGSQTGQVESEKPFDGLERVTYGAKASTAKQGFAVAHQFRDSSPFLPEVKTSPFWSLESSKHGYLDLVRHALSFLIRKEILKAPSRRAVLSRT